MDADLQAWRDGARDSSLIGRLAYHLALRKAWEPLWQVARTAPLGWLANLSEFLARQPDLDLAEGGLVKRCSRVLSRLQLSRDAALCFPTDLPSYAGAVPQVEPEGVVRIPGGVLEMEGQTILRIHPLYTPFAWRDESGQLLFRRQHFISKSRGVECVAAAGPPVVPSGLTEPQLDAIKEIFGGAQQWRDLWEIVLNLNGIHTTW